jgi:heat shock protein HslJ
MLRISRFLLLGISLIVVLAAACTSTATNQNLTGTKWKLAALNGKAPVTSDNSVILNFDPNNQISGNSGCNSYGGDYTASGSALSFSKVFSTLMACADQSVNDQEAAFHQALSKVATFEISNGQLNLKDASGTVLLTFGKA